MNMRGLFASSLVVGAGALSCSTPTSLTVTFTDTWCNDPSRFPEFAAEPGLAGRYASTANGGSSAGAHISPVIMATHSGAFSLWATGTLASPAIGTQATTGSPAGLVGTGGVLPTAGAAVLDTFNSGSNAGVPGLGVGGTPSCGASNAGVEVLLTKTATLQLDASHTFFSSSTMIVYAPATAHAPVGTVAPLCGARAHSSAFTPRVHARRPRRLTSSLASPPTTCA